MKRRRVLGLVAGTLLVSGTVVNAGQEPALESTLARRAAVLAARTNLGGASAPVLGTAAVRVIGFAWKADDTPVAYPVLRIRDLQDGQVAARTTGTALGEFRFDSLHGGTYLIELLDTESRILAVGQPLVVLPGETVATFIRLSDADDRILALAIASRQSLNAVGQPLEVGQPQVVQPTGSAFTARTLDDRLFVGAAKRVVGTADDAQVPAIGGGRAASNES